MKNFKTLITFLLLSFSFHSQAALFVVADDRDLPDNDLMDGICDAGLIANEPVCTLRAAVMQTNASQGEADTILLPNNIGIYKLGLFGDEEDSAMSSDLDITDDLTIINGTQAGATIDGKFKDRIFHVHANASLTLEGINLISGSVNTNNDNSGGAVLVVS